MSTSAAAVPGTCSARIKKQGMRVLDLFTDPIPNVARLKRNWWIIYMSAFVTAFSWTVTYASLHQFVIALKPEDIESEEDLYAWIVGSFSIGEFFAALIFAALVKYFRVKTLYMAAICSVIVGSLLFGIGTNVWMLLVGRFFQGLQFGAVSVLLRIYLGETSNIAIHLKGESSEKSQIKNTNFFFAFALATFGLSVGPAASALVVQIPSVDQFRWSGWVLVTAGLLVLTVFAVYFVELPTDINRQGGKFSLRSFKPAVPVYGIAFLVIVFFVINCGFSVIEALVNPILTDQFGLNLEFVSYVFVASISIFMAANFLTFALQQLHLHNKTICLIGILCGICGTIIIVDWQSLGGDPCDRFSYDQFNSTAYWIDDPSSIPEHPLNLSLPEGLCPPNNTQLCLSAAQACLNHSGPPEECFWNQQSRITGVFCQECVKLCRSERTSLNFAQFLFGLFVFSLAFPICRISTTVLISDSVGKEGQSFIMGVFVASGSISKAIGPPIGVALMLRARRRTFSVMFPMIGMLGAVLVVFLALYRKLSPKQEELHPDRSQLETTSDDDKEMMAFFSSEEEEDGCREVDDFKEKDDCGLGSAGSETIL